MKNLIDLSIIIVSFNTKELTLKCLESILKAATSKDRWEVIVVEKGSSDGRIEKIKNEKLKMKNVTVIQNAQNLGFAKANNIGIRKSKGRYVLLLNSDTEVPKGTIQTMLAFMKKHPDAGVATCKVLQPSGSLDPACHRGFPTPWAAFTYFLGLERIFSSSPLFSRYHLGYKDMNNIHEIDS